MPGIPLFQYWHDGKPAEEVARLIAGWASASDFEHRLFDHEAATAFIERHAGARTAACFLSCAVPAMQSDVFRYVALHAEGGIWLDAENVPGERSLATFLQSLPVGLLCERRGNPPSHVWFCNDMLYVRKPGHPLFQRLIEFACENIEARQVDNVWEATGPWLLNRLKKSSDAHLLEGFDRVWYGDMAQYVRPVGKLAYKKGAEDWRRYSKEGRSIYRSDKAGVAPEPPKKITPEITGSGHVIQIDKSVQHHPNLSIRIEGEGNRLFVGAGAHLHQSRIHISGAGCVVRIGKGCRLKVCTIMVAGEGSQVRIGQETSWESGSLLVDLGTSVVLGADCMLSSEVVICTSDGHGIFDRASGQQINAAKPIHIGRHVWLGNGSRVNKGTRIGDGAVLEQMSVASGRLHPATVYAGVPARAIRENIVWARSYDFQDAPPDLAAPTPAPKPQRKVLGKVRTGLRRLFRAESDHLAGYPAARK